MSVEELTQLADSMAADRMKSMDIASNLEKSIAEHTRHLEQLKQQLAKGESSSPNTEATPDDDGSVDLVKARDELKRQAAMIKEQMPDIEALAAAYKDVE